MFLKFFKSFQIRQTIKVGHGKSWLHLKCDGGSIREYGTTTSVPILLVFLSFCLSMFYHSSYSKKFEIIIYFVYHLLYYQKYFTYDLSFFIFALIFQKKRMVKRCK